VTQAFPPAGGPKRDSAVIGEQDVGPAGTFENPV
jgi:hypothetical protein